MTGTSAFAGDYGLMLARTDWTLPKHEGLTMFLVPLDAAGITMRRIKEVNGNEEFCEEFFGEVVAVVEQGDFEGLGEG